MMHEKYNRNHLVNVRVSHDEYEAMMRATDESGDRSFSEFCRKAIMCSTVYHRLTRLETMADKLRTLLSHRP